MSEFEDTFEPQPEETVEPEAIEPEEAQVEEVSAEPEIVEEPKEEPKSDTVPLALFLDMKNELKQIKQEKAQPQYTPPPVPDVLENQEGFVQSIQQQVQHATQTAQLNVSEAMAREAHGDETVNEALQAAQAAGVTAQFSTKPHAWNEMVKWHNTQKAAAVQQR